ncbi:DNA cytosine methyltransferase [Psychrobacillus psychrodurans]|uniref:DNA cytosine methyltransferase n=1 Tax=Psychrobacillus psychrodurans TaxID=126157 RepID=UPI001F4DF1BA|nr:DNA cytosine methyltransferase [Psychrobacillus psychrodurans]MCK1996818.1 DNA cytosine methyltransferase [Psychrobacillus psychrodurans]
MKFLDLFAGIGGFRLGLEQAGHECVGYVEWDKYARKSYEAIHNTEGEWTAHDITTVTDDDLRTLANMGIEIITGGFPCQSFSVAGKRGGFNDTRGTMFFEIARIAKQIKPRIILLENVKGLLSHDKGNTFGTILHTLDELGYDCEWQVLNTKDFSTKERPTPQNRERVFIIGHLRGTSRSEVLPIRRENETPISIAGYLSEGFEAVNYVLDPKGIAKCLTTMGGGNREPKVLVNEPKVVTVGNIGNGHGGYDVVSDGGLCPTLKARDYKGPIQVLREKKVRKLTPRECWRLQGFPDWAFERAAEVNSDSQLYKQAGNSVTVNVIYEIGKRLI